MNFTYGTLIMFLATIPELIAMLLSLINYFKRKYLHYIYMFATWFFLWLGNLLLAIGYLTLNLVVYKIGLVATVPLTISIILLMDSISRETIDPKKLSLAIILSTLACVFVFDKDVVALNISKLGEIGPSVIGRLNYALAALFVLSSAAWFYYFLILYLKSPKNLKEIARLNLIGATIGGPGAALAYTSGIVWFLPGTDYLLIAIGALFSAYSFSREPKLGYVLPFKVSRLMIVNIETGIPLFSYTWDDTGLIDSDLFSAAIQGITMILKESLGKGLVQEIKLERATLLIKVAEKDYPLAFVLITTKTSAILNQSLANFASIIERTIPKAKIEEVMTLQSINFEPYINSAFPYVVFYK